MGKKIRLDLKAASEMPNIEKTRVPIYRKYFTKRTKLED
jgi:hypothetical protein